MINIIHCLPASVPVRCLEWRAFLIGFSASFFVFSLSISHRLEFYFEQHSNIYWWISCGDGDVSYERKTVLKSFNELDHIKNQKYWFPSNNFRRISQTNSCTFTAIINILNISRDIFKGHRNGIDSGSCRYFFYCFLLLWVDWICFF